MIAKKKFKDADVHVSEGEKKITVHKIVVPKEKRGKGIGTKVMNEIHSYADKVGKPVVLTPSEDFGGSKSKLKKFYKNLGYIENKGKKKDYEISETMYRKKK